MLELLKLLVKEFDSPYLSAKQKEAIAKANIIIGKDAEK